MSIINLAGAHLKDFHLNKRNTVTVILSQEKFLYGNKLAGLGCKK